MGGESAATLVERLKAGRDALTPELEVALEQRGVEGIDALIALACSEDLLAASEPEGWAPIYAIRLLGRFRAMAAIPALVSILEGAEEDDLASAEAAQALRHIGPDVLPALAGFLRATDNPHGRGLALETVVNLRGDYQDGVAFDAVRREIERMLLAEADVGTRIVLAQYLGDLGHEQSVDTVLRAVARPDLTALEYDALRDVLERLGAACPDLYFDGSGKGYPLDEEKVPHCPACGATMSIQESGDLRHPAPACAATGEIGCDPLG